MESALSKLIVLAAIGEAVWQTLKMVWQPKEALGAERGKINPDKIGALVVGLLIAFGSGLDLPAMVGIPMAIPYLGIVLTGILLSRGAGFVHDLLTYLKSLKEILLNKANSANLERKNTGIMVDSKNLPDGTKVGISTPEGEPEPNIIDKTKNMIAGVAETANRVVKVIRSTPEVKTEDVPSPPSESPTPPAEPSLDGPGELDKPADNNRID